MAWWDFWSSIPQDVSTRADITGSTSRSHSPSYIPLIEQKDEEIKIQEVQHTSYTFKSHGVKVALTHVHDWLVLLLLVVLKVVLHFVHPFCRFVGKDMMTYLKYPLKSNTLPTWVVQAFSTLLPMGIFVIVYFRRRDIYDLHHATLGLLFSVLVTSVITDVIKDTVGQPRPDFFWRCFPDGNDAYDNLGNVICSGDKHIVREGYKSFPSGHTSWAFAGLGFLSLYLSGKIKAFDHKGHVTKLCIVVLPLFVASLVGISRVDDYWHHWQDVFVGGCLGFMVATFCYLHFFPPPYHPQGWGPYSYFQALEETQASLQQANCMNTEVIKAEENDKDDTSEVLPKTQLTSNSNFSMEDV